MRTLATLCTAAVLFCQAVPAPADAPAPLAAFATAWIAMNGYSTTINCYVVKGAQNVISNYDYAFTKPTTISMRVVSGPGAGNTVNWSGGDSVVAGRGMFTKRFALTDPTVTSIRGATVVDLSFGSILQHAQQTAGEVTTQQLDLSGVATNVINLKVADPAKDNGLTSEALFLSAATNLPVRVDGYEGSQMVNSCTFSNTTPK